MKVLLIILGVILGLSVVGLIIYGIFAGVVLKTAKKIQNKVFDEFGKMDF